ncbi:hypothetical protein DIPPA_02172 [Diplonema papillatum]|nr:hypothetical protein DIPPA_02172 [Diplonema papillatum]
MEEAGGGRRCSAWGTTELKDVLNGRREHAGGGSAAQCGFPQDSMPMLGLRGEPGTAAALMDGYRVYKGAPHVMPRLSRSRPCTPSNPKPACTLHRAETPPIPCSKPALVSASNRLPPASRTHCQHTYGRPDPLHPADTLPATCGQRAAGFPAPESPPCGARRISPAQFSTRAHRLIRQNAAQAHSEGERLRSKRARSRFLPACAFTKPPPGAGRPVAPPAKAAGPMAARAQRGAGGEAARTMVLHAHKKGRRGKLAAPPPPAKAWSVRGCRRVLRRLPPGAPDEALEAVRAALLQDILYYPARRLLLPVEGERRAEVLLQFLMESEALWRSFTARREQLLSGFLADAFVVMRESAARAYDRQ